MKKYLIFTILLSGLVLSGCVAKVGDGDLNVTDASSVSVVQNEDGSMKIVKNTKDVKETETDNSEVSDTETNGTKANVDAIKAPVGVNAGKLINLERENDGYKIGYPKNWYYSVDHANAKIIGYEVIVGFASSSKVWDMKPPYPVELQIIPDSILLKKSESSYSKKIGEKEGMYYMLVTSKEEYNEIVDLMAESFEFLSN